MTEGRRGRRTAYVRAGPVTSTRATAPGHVFAESADFCSLSRLSTPPIAPISTPDAPTGQRACAVWPSRAAAPRDEPPTPRIASKSTPHAPPGWRACAVWPSRAAAPRDERVLRDHQQSGCACGARLATGTPLLAVRDVCDACDV
eukprot:350867-Chlamydomonas_euryale.AAC.1